MEAKVLSVEVGKKFVSKAGSTYTATSLITQGKPYKGQVKDPREHRFFTSNPLHDKVAKLKPGQWINYKCDNSKFKNMESFEVIGADAGVDTGAQTASSTFIKEMEGQSQSASIARAVALKAAVDSCSTMLTKDMFKKSAKPDFIANEILTMAAFFEKYLTFTDDITSEETVDEDSLNQDDDLSE